MISSSDEGAHERALQAPVRWDELHYRLTNLWELLMISLPAAKFMGAYQHVVSLGSALMTGAHATGSFGDNVVSAITKPQIERLKEDVHALQDWLVDLEMDLASDAAARLLSEINSIEMDGAGASLNKMQVIQLDHQFRQLIDRVPAEFRSRIVLVLPYKAHLLYRPQEPLFGSEVADKFRTTAKEEIEDAGKCLALGLGTACAFHLLRAVEYAFEAIQKCLQLPQPVKGPQKAWGAVLDRYWTELEGREQLTWPRQWSSMQDRQDFKEIYQFISAVKDTSRDKTMHAVSRYDTEKARELFDVTKAFMKKVASRMDEDGLPLA